MATMMGAFFVGELVRRGWTTVKTDPAIPPEDLPFGDPHLVDPLTKKVHDPHAAFQIQVGRDETAHRELKNLMAVVVDVHGQRGEDACWMDIDRVFQAAGLTVPDRRVGDRLAMLANCVRFVDTMCADGPWPSYAELEAALRAVKRALDAGLATRRATLTELIDPLVARLPPTGPATPLPKPAPPPAARTPECRTRSEVLAARQNAAAGGCCNRFAEMSGCDCLANARPDPVPCPECGGSGYAVHPQNGFNRDARRCSRGCQVHCSICNNPFCDNPGGQH